MALSKLAPIVLKKLLKKARTSLVLQKRGPLHTTWNADIRFVSKAQMKSFNAKYRKKNKPTDVLSFPSPKLFWNEGLLGDILICEPVLKSQAKSLKHSPLKELHVLLAHSLLHLLGFDHKTETKRRVMKKQEAFLLGTLLGLIERSHSGKT